MGAGVDRGFVRDFKDGLEPEALMPNRRAPAACRPDLGTRTQAAEAVHVVLVQRTASVRDPQLVVCHQERNPVIGRAHAGHRIVGVLQQLVDEPSPIVARDLRLLAHVFLQPRRSDAVDVEVLLDDALDDVAAARHGSPSNLARRA